MYQMRIPSIGLVYFSVDNMYHHRDATVLHAKDEHNNPCIVRCARIVFQSDRFADYGWIHTLSYAYNGKTVPFDKYLSLA